MLRSRAIEFEIKNIDFFPLHFSRNFIFCTFIILLCLLERTTKHAIYYLSTKGIVHIYQYSKQL